LFTTRILYEWLFPAVLWLGKPFPVLLVGLGAALLGVLCWRLLASRISGSGWSLSITSPEEAKHIFTSASGLALVPFLPWYGGLFYLLSDQVDLVTSRLLYFGLLWLSVVLMLRTLAKPKTWSWLGPVLLLSALTPIYLLTLGQTVGTADTFEFQVVVPKLGIVHPTGYPLYLMLSKLFTYLPVNSAAWRINFGAAVFALGAAVMMYLLLWKLQKRPSAALLGAMIFGLTPTFWSQAVEAEVYTLHALFVVTALFLMRAIGGWSISGNKQNPAPFEEPDESSSGLSLLARISHSARQPYGELVLLAFILGLGLTNHLTTVLLFPGAVLTIFFAYRAGRFNNASFKGFKAAGVVAAAFLVPLILYAYLPLRWQAVNGEPMGIGRFIDWVIGGRFQGALQLSAWLQDSTRYEVVGRLMRYEWGTAWLLLAIIGVIWLFIKSWRFALTLSVSWLAFVFYGLNYYVPDLAVFLLPAFLLVAIFWSIGLGSLYDGLLSLFNVDSVISDRAGETAAAKSAILGAVLTTALLGLILIQAGDLWRVVDASSDDGRTRWARAVLSLPIDEGAAILADSDKFPPLYYLQQVEGIRPDIDILLLPDEGAYRDELTRRINAGQPVFLARYLPGLEGSYHLGSTGPLTRVSMRPELELPEGVISTQLQFGPLELIGYELDDPSLYGEGQLSAVLYWMASETLDELLHIYVRLAGDGSDGAPDGRHAANNYYPTSAWQPDEIVSDFHLLDIVPGGASDRYGLEVAVAPPFTPSDELQWVQVTDVPTGTPAMPEFAPVRAVIGPVYLDGIEAPEQARPQSRITILATGVGANADELVFELRDTMEGIDKPGELSPGVPVDGAVDTLIVKELSASDVPGIYHLFLSYPGQNARCGWMRSESGDCNLGQIAIAGVPLPGDAVNFEDKIALLDIEVPSKELQPGGRFDVTLHWQSLSEMEEDYTVFVQILDSEDRIVGQVDSWPMQGTYPTTQWQPGESISDPYEIQLDSDLVPGSYRLVAGLYLLETLDRLAVIGEAGNAVDDKAVLPGLVVP
jgi:hypothetical protein